VIASVAGRVTALGPDAAVVEVAGIGLSVQCTPATLAGLQVGQQAALPTSLVVREESLTLYGFADDDERVVFELLLASEDLAALTLVPGIGRKGAQRIVLELKDRLGAPTGRVPDVTIPAPGRGWGDQLHGALVGLGWSAREADEADQAVAAAAPTAEQVVQDGGRPDVADLLKVALRSLSRA
jgi:Holliday junction DNA helicase RuvA